MGKGGKAAGGRDIGEVGRRGRELLDDSQQ